MTTFIGRLLTIGLAKESSRGLGASPTYLLPDITFSFDDKVVKVRETAGIGTIADSDASFVTTKYGAGDLEGEVRDKSFGLLLYNIFGAVSSSGAVDSAYTHTYTLTETNNHQSLCLTVDDANTTEQYRLVMIDKLDLSLELDDVLKYTASFLSKKGNDSGATMATLTAENKFTKANLSFKVATDIAGLAGATAVSVKSLKLTFTKNAVMNDVLGTAEPEDIFNRAFSVEGQVVLNYTDETWKNYMRDNSSKAMEIKFTSDSNIGAGSTKSCLTFQMPKVDFFEWEPDYTLDEIVTQTVSFKANRDVTNSLAPISTCTLVNGASSY